MPDAYQNPTEECDLVMQGGITSGVVYPPAVLDLAKKYRFRSIGGTSAGAIAAAVTAAAEYNREHDGFTRFEALSSQLAQPEFLFNLFQPSDTTRPLMNIILASMKKETTPQWRYVQKGLRFTKLLLTDTPASFAEGAVLGATLSSVYTILTGGSIKGPGVITPLLFGWLGGIAKSGYDLVQILRKDIPQQHFFGLCTGHSDDTSSAQPPLTDWLSVQINQVAGKPGNSTPLTYRDLAQKGAGQESITLRMVTTNLSQNLPYVLPFETNTFLFKEQEMRALFPKNVVDYLVEHAYQTPNVSLEQVPGYHFLPEGDALPIVVGMRMSLSFPLLISAIPLYTIKQSALRRRAKGQNVIQVTPSDLQKNWFSDGGICSNFPIHFFDAWLPTRPTFGINLISQPQETFDSPAKTAVSSEYLSVRNVAAAARTIARQDNVDTRINQAVHLPRADEEQFPQWQEINRFLDFAHALLDAAMNYRDTLQSMLPSYRDRIVQVRFDPDEGGLNLAMDSTTIKTIQGKGEQAAQEIERTFKMEYHQWVRTQVLMGLVERQLNAMQTAIHKIDYERMIQDQLASQHAQDPQQQFPYPQTKEWCDKTLARIEGLSAFVEKWKSEGWLVKEPKDPIEPAPVLRVTPKL